MPKKTLPIEHFAGALKALELVLNKCTSQTDACIRSGIESAKVSLDAGVAALKDQFSRDIDFYTSVAGYGYARNLDIEKSEAALKKLEK